MAVDSAVNQICLMLLPKRVLRRFLKLNYYFIGVPYHWNPKSKCMEFKPKLENAIRCVSILHLCYSVLQLQQIYSQEYDLQDTAIGAYFFVAYAMMWFVRLDLHQLRPDCFLQSLGKFESKLGGQGNYKSIV